MNILFSDKTETNHTGNLVLVEFITGDGKIAEHMEDAAFVEAITLNNLCKASAEGKSNRKQQHDRALFTYAIEQMVMSPRQ